MAHYCPIFRGCGVNQGCHNLCWIPCMVWIMRLFFFFFFPSGNTKNYLNVPVKHWMRWQWKYNLGNEDMSPRVFVSDNHGGIAGSVAPLSICCSICVLLKINSRKAHGTRCLSWQDWIWFQVCVPGTCTENCLCGDDWKQQLERELSISLLMSAEHQDRNWIIFRCQNTT